MIADRKRRSPALESGQVILDGQFDAFRDRVHGLLPGVRGHRVTEDEFEDFAESFLALPSPEALETVYGRVGFAFVNQLDHDEFQLLACQINLFGPGVFGAERTRFTTPLLLTVRVRPRRRYAHLSLRETPLEIAELHLSRHFCGSKGELCRRDLFLEQARRLLVHEAVEDCGQSRLFYEVMNTNYLCHHIAETLGYALGGLESFWRENRTPLFMLAGSRYEEEAEKLHLEILDDFAGEPMRCRFKIPRYRRIGPDPGAFKEPYESMVCEITYRDESELFAMPVGFQREQNPSGKGRINHLTTQHLLQHLLKEYYHRPAVFIVASTFQTLAYLTRGFIARRDGHPERCACFLRRMTTCMGYYPARDFAGFWREKEKKFERRDTDVDTAMFFRSPVML